MEYQIEYRNYCGKNIIDYTTETIDAKNDKEIIQKAKDLLKNLRREAQEKNSRETYRLLGIYNVGRKKVTIHK